MWKHPFRTFGYPADRDYGQFALGQLLAPVGAGWFQLEGTNITGAALAEGFSGAPVWDEEARGIVGMVVSVDPPGREHEKIGYMIPHFIIEREIFKVALSDRARVDSQMFAYWERKEIKREYVGIMQESDKAVIDELSKWLLGQGHTVERTEFDNGVEIRVTKDAASKGRKSRMLLHRYTIRATREGERLRFQFRVDQLPVGTGVALATSLALGAVGAVANAVSDGKLDTKAGLKMLGLAVGVRMATKVGERVSYKTLERAELPKSAAWVLDQHVYSGRFGASVAAIGDADDSS